MSTTNETVAAPRAEMKFKDIRDQYYTVTGKASDVGRQLAFVGFAAIWVFREGTTGINVPAAMVPAAIGFGAALVCDVLQYGVAAHLWRKQVDRADKTCQTDDDACEVPPSTNNWPRAFFTLKLWCVGASYAWYLGTLVYLLVTKFV